MEAKRQKLIHSLDPLSLKSLVILGKHETALNENIIKRGQGQSPLPSQRENPVSGNFVTRCYDLIMKALATRSSDN